MFTYQGKTALIIGASSGIGLAFEAASVGKRRTPEQVVATGLRALEQGRSVVIDGTANALLAGMPRLAPRWLVTRIAGRTVHP